MTLQEQYDDAMFDFSQGDFASATEKLKAVLAQDPENFEAQLALGMAHYRLGDFKTAIAEGHKAEKLRPKEQLVHTNLSLFYMKSGDKVTAEHHGLQARIAGWRAENEAAKAKLQDSSASGPVAAAAEDPELQMAKPKPPAVKVIRMPDKFPDQPWKKEDDDLAVSHLPLIVGDHINLHGNNDDERETRNHSYSPWHPLPSDGRGPE